MYTLLQRFCQLSFKERFILYNSVFESEIAINHLITLFRCETKDTQIAILAALTPSEVAWFNRMAAEFPTDTEPEEAIYYLENEFLKLPILIEEYQKKEKYAQEQIRLRRDWMKHVNPEVLSDQNLGIQVPPQVKKAPINTSLVELPAPENIKLIKPTILDCIKDRASRRLFNDTPLSKQDLSYLLWATQGVRKQATDRPVHFKVVPSGGARQPFETYLLINHVKDIEQGIYRYLPFDHKLVLLSQPENAKEKMEEYCYNQSFCGYCAVCFIWTAIPYRTEWRYNYAASKDILVEAGHICQNLYLACESLQIGTCAILAYDQQKLDDFIGVDGENEFVVYLSPVGKFGNEKGTL